VIYVGVFVASLRDFLDEVASALVSGHKAEGGQGGGDFVEDWGALGLQGNVAEAVGWRLDAGPGVGLEDELEIEGFGLVVNATAH